jgi:hypothetical protein
MYAIKLLQEGAQQGSIGWMVWVALAIFFAMVFLGWLVSGKGWLKKEEEPMQDSHSHDDHNHDDHVGHSESHH